MQGLGLHPSSASQFAAEFLVSRGYCAPVAAPTETPKEKEGRARKRACASLRAAAASLSFLVASHAHPTPGVGCPAPLGAKEGCDCSAWRPIKTRSFSSQCNWQPEKRAVRRRRLTPWRLCATAEAAIGGGQRPRLLTSGAGLDALSTPSGRPPSAFPPPPFHHGRLCVVWGAAVPPCSPVALTASPSPRTGRSHRSLAPQTLEH